MIITTISCLRGGGGEGQHANPAEARRRPPGREYTLVRKEML